LAWDANTEEDLAGYKLYYGVAPGTYPQVIDVGNVTQFTKTGLAENTNYYFAATAYNSADPVLESGFSNEIMWNSDQGPIAIPFPACCAEWVIAEIEATEIILEAEAAELSESIQIGTANGVTYVFSPTMDRGYITFSFNIAESGSYSIDARVNANGSDGQDSFYVKMPDPVESEIRINWNIYDTVRLSEFTWDEVSLRGETGTFERADYDPMIWELMAGAQRLLFAVRESDTWLDKIKIRKR